MDLLRSCTSGVHIVDGFKIIPYKVFAIDKTAESVKRTFVARWEILNAEYNARKNGLLLMTDFKKLQLWTFGKPQSSTASTSSASNEPFKLPSGSSLRCIHSGEFLTSQLQKESTSEKSGSSEKFTPREIYSCFVSACLRSLTLRIAEQQNIIPLGAHAFVIYERSTERREDLTGSKPPGRHGRRIFSLKIELMENGSLQIFTKCYEQHLQSIADCFQEKGDNEESECPWLVFIAPSNRLARTNWREEMLSKSVNFSLAESKTHLAPELLFTEPQQRIWKRTVLQWLKWQGLDFLNPSMEKDWAKITVFLKFPHIDDATPRSRARAGRLTLDWPAQLCHRRKRSSKPSTDCFDPGSFSNEVHDGTQWFQSTTGEGFHDPLTSAFYWMEEKTQMESEMEARRVKDEAEKAEVVAQDASIEFLDPQSPLDARTLSYQDAQVIYPTPSDELPAHVTPGSTSFDIGSSQPSHFRDIGSSPGIDLGDAELKGLSPNGHDNFVPDQSYGAEDQDFGPNGLTDADFDFFDLPDMNTRGEQSDNMDVDDIVDEETAKERHIPGGVLGDAADLATAHLEPSLASAEVAGQTKLGKRAQKQDAAIDPYRSKVHFDLDAGLRLTDSSKVIEPAMVDSATIGVALSKSEPSNDMNIPNTTHGMTIDDHKYLSDGRFGFLPRKQLKKPSTSYLVGQDRGRILTEFSSPTSIIRNIKGTSQMSVGPHAHHSKRPTIDQSNGKGDSDSSGSDVDEYSSKPFSSTTAQPSKSNLFEYISNDDMMQSQSTSRMAESRKNQRYWSMKDFDALAGMMLTGYFKSPSTNWALTHFLTAEPVDAYHSLNLETTNPVEVVQIAQLFLDQVAVNFPRLGLIKAFERSKEFDQAEADFETSSSSCVSQAISALFTTSTRTEPDLLSIMSFPSLGQGAKEVMEMFGIAPAQVRLQRSRQPWDFGSSATAFWETLGLEPTHGPKEVTVFCVYPGSEAIKACVDSFLETMESCWLNQKLGSHEPGQLDDLKENGHVPVYVERNAPEEKSVKNAMASFSDVCRNLGSRLNAKYGPEERILVYIVNPFEDAIALGSLCGAFWELIRGYSGDANVVERAHARNISLQIVPIDLIASTDSPVPIDPETANSLVHMVYDQCQPSEIALDGADLPIPSGASIILGEPVAQTVSFQLSSSPSSNVLSEDSCLHIAYCESHDRSWVAVAWTDGTGEYQHKACYHLGGLPTAGSVIKEIWETTLEIIKARRVRWRLFVVKCGFLNPHERKIWDALSSSRAGTSRKLSILAVNTSPSLNVAIKPSAKIALMDHTVPTVINYSTPVSTPHPQHMGSSPAAPSPSNIMAVSTPSAFPTADQAAGADAEQSTHLIDKTDESWGIVLQRRLNSSESLVEYNPALASGYLMKRTGVGDLDPPVLMEVNLIYHQEHAKHPSAGHGAEEGDEKGGRTNSYTDLLHEVLVMYRNLGLLARLRKIEGRDSCVPWHIAVATKAADALSRCMKL